MFAPFGKRGGSRSSVIQSHFLGYELDVWTVAKLNAEGVIQGVKLVHGAASQVHDLLLLAPELCLFYGHDLEAPQALLTGAHGWIAALIFPGACRVLMRAAQAGNSQKPSPSGGLCCRSRTTCSTTHPVRNLSIGLGFSRQH